MIGGNEWELLARWAVWGLESGAFQACSFLSTENFAGFASTSTPLLQIRTPRIHDDIMIFIFAACSGKVGLQSRRVSKVLAFSRK